MKSYRVKVPIIAAGIIPLLVQLSQHIDIQIPMVVKSSLCTVSVAVLSSILGIWGKFE